jgi:hypothetical protein
MSTCDLIAARVARYALNPDAVEGREGASIDLPVFQEIPPS